MHILVTAFALTFALPAAAQTAPVQPQQPAGSPAAHGQHHNGQHHNGQHHGQDHDQHHGQGAQAGHCCPDADGNGRPDCCDRMDHGQHGARTGQHAPADRAPQAHQGH